MLTQTTTGPKVESSFAMATPERPANWPLVRVIWGRYLGSTYQRYCRPTGRPLSRQVEPTYWFREASIFSVPLTCPACRGKLALQQPDDDSPDRLLGTCCDCRAWYLLDVAEDGRISSTELPNRH